MKAFLTAATLLIALAGQAAAQSTPQELHKMFLKAFRDGDAAAAARLYMKDADLYDMASLHVKGRAAIQRAWGGFLNNNKIVKLVDMPDGLQVVGDMAVAWGRFTVVFVPKGSDKPVTMTGRYMDMARKVGGVWRYVVDHASVPLPPAKK